MIICVMRQTPSNEPKFQAIERLGGLGRSITEALMFLMNGRDFRWGVMLFFC